MEIKKLIALTFIVFLFLLFPYIVLAQDSSSTNPGYQRINPQTGEFQPIPPKGIIYTPPDFC